MKNMRLRVRTYVILSMVMIFGVLALSGCANAGRGELSDTIIKAAEENGTDLGVQPTQKKTQSVVTPEDNLVMNITTPDPADIIPADEIPDVIDLTTMSPTFVYSEVYNMMILPENYIGKDITMEGLFSTYHDEATDKYYFACIIQDATACCAQGIEFELAGDFKYPEDYPKEGDIVKVRGIFETYVEDGYTYCRLSDAKML